MGSTPEERDEEQLVERSVTVVSRDPVPKPLGDKNHPERGASRFPRTGPALRINDSVLDRDAIYADYNLEPVQLSPPWRVMPIVIYLLTILSSMIWIVSFGAAQNDFRGFCLLFGSIKYSLGFHHRIRHLYLEAGSGGTNSAAGAVRGDDTHHGSADYGEYSSILTGDIMDEVNGTVNSLPANLKNDSIASIDYINTSWGPVCICNFCLYLGVASLFYAFLFCMFFSLCQIGRTQYAMLEHPSRLVLPALLLSFIFSLLTVVAAWLITKGVDYWCKGIEDGPLKECQDVVGLVWVNNGKHIMNPGRQGTFYTFVKVAKVSSWMTAIFWVTCTMILMVRFFGAADFQKSKPKYKPGSTILRFSDSDYSLKGDRNDSNRNFDTTSDTLPYDSDDETQFVTHTPSEIYKMTDDVSNAQLVLSDPLSFSVKKTVISPS